MAPPPSTPPPEQGSLASLLRQTEAIVVSAPARLLLPSARVQAEVVVVRHTSGGVVESGVLVVAPPRPRAPARVLRTLAITPGTAAALTQTPPSPSSSFFAQSSKPHIELTLTSAERKAVLQFPPADSARVQTLIREIRAAVDSSFAHPASHAWLEFYPESEGSVPATPSDEDTSLERSFGALDASDAKADAKVDGDEAELYPNPYTVGFSRTAFLRKRLFGRQDKWSSTTPVSIRVVTYNVNNRIPPTGTKELAPVVGYGAEDIIVVGLQEVDLRSSALFVSQGNQRAEAWEQAIYNGLGDRKEQYETVSSIQYVGVLLIVIARSELRPEVRMVQESARGIGLMGFGGNKAGVAVRLKVHDTTLCFVNSHLAAWKEYLERRRSDYIQLRTLLTFPTPTDINPPLEAYHPEDRDLMVDDADVIFWLGDLNYRLELDDADIRGLITTQDWDALLTSDQLLTDIADNKSFIGFSEPRITFRPSFKYVHGSVTLDPKRSPAYCDRVLHRSRGTAIESKQYTTHDLLWSDHLPVTSTYSIDARVVDETKRGEALVECQCELDKLDELYRASLEVNTGEIDFGEVKYRRPTKKEIVLRNTGRVPATFSFRTPSPGKPICKPWFWPFPAAGVVESGQEVSLIVEAFVDEDHAAALTGGQDLNDVLVLQIQGGKESFISLQAQFLPTIVGLPLELLPDLPAAIREVPLATRKELLNPKQDDTDKKDDDESKAKAKGTKTAREVWRLLERLMAEGAGVDKLWTGEADATQVLDIIDALDSGADSLPGDARATAQALLHILYTLPTKLIPPEQRAECQAVQERDDAFAVVEKIAGVHGNVLIGLTSVVRLCNGAEVADEATVTALATAIFGERPLGREVVVRALLQG
ncbi:hypothetical protein Q8F55_003607 [Vanrija albida]|uniref:Inositol polyphosphate-related phosphatase domain-containing protein n=1 Tax=Vanrija albida TaxID=181172 RepID=A0ABR3Q571_9TREE